MSFPTSAAKTRSTEIGSLNLESKSVEGHDKNTDLPLIGIPKFIEKIVHVSAPESISMPSPSESSTPIIKVRSKVLIAADKEAALMPTLTITLTPEMQSVFKNIDSGNLKFFDLVPGKRIERNAHGIDLDMVHPKTLHTPLTMALQSGQIEIAVMLLVLGADPLAVNGKEIPPMEVASSLSRMFLRFFILRRQPEVKVENSKPRERFLQLLNTVNADSGETMLSWAVTHRQDKLACLLILAGADFKCRNAKNAAPLEVAARYGSMQLVNAMTETWPQLASYAKLPYVKQAIVGATEMNRPSVIAHLLAFFRAEFRARNDENEDNVDIDSIDLHEDIPPSPQIEDEAFEFFMNDKSQPALTVQQLMHRSSDRYLLTEKECWLLELDKAAKIAEKMGHQRVLGIFAAHREPRV